MLTELQKIGGGTRAVQIAGQDLILSALTGNDLVAFESEFGSWSEAITDPARFFTVRRWILWRMLKPRQEKLALEEVGALLAVADFRVELQNADGKVIQPSGLVEELINSMMPPPPKDDGAEGSPSPQPGEPTS